ncbi:Histidine kinase [Ralstonia sp. 25mfcol4.1]|uniref:sensor histidine kinase n=1 Tax=Ralstonia sp. 25mfcol4.1 TaxID=1761899 RepID=UPI0006762F09|nr:histidine kinase [Ralstonia sp. 25mfcol4.1]SDP72459.1 Histidine kinase [Ralstonia sp. 25mfcol4.1]
MQLVADRKRLVVLGGTFIAMVALAVVAWWPAREGGADIGLPGFLLGIAFVGIMALVIAFLDRHQSAQAAALMATLQALLEITAGAAVVAGLSMSAVYALPSPVVSRLFVADALADLIVIACVGLALLAAVRYWRRYAAARAQATEAQVAVAKATAAAALRDKELAQSQLMLLQAQVEPHFLWNSLAHVQFLISKDPADATRMMAHLIRYLRAAMPQMREKVSTLGTEMESVEAYLALMKIRMGARLTVSVNVAEDLRAQEFPPLLLQTLVENAIKHGVEPKIGPVSVTVSAALNGVQHELLVLDVEDDGVGLQATPPTRGTGIGLRNVRERLRLAYGEGAALTIMAAPRGGVIARISIPGATGAA